MKLNKLLLSIVTGITATSISNAADYNQYKTQDQISKINEQSTTTDWIEGGSSWFFSTVYNIVECTKYIKVLSNNIELTPWEEKRYSFKHSINSYFYDAKRSIEILRKTIKKTDIDILKEVKSNSRFITGIKDLKEIMLANTYETEQMPPEIEIRVYLIKFLKEYGLWG